MSLVLFMMVIGLIFIIIGNILNLKNFNQFLVSISMLIGHLMSLIANILSDSRISIIFIVLFSLFSLFYLVSACFEFKDLKNKDKYEGEIIN